MRSSSAASKASGRPAKPATTSAVRSSAVGPSPPEVIDERDALPGEELERRAHVVGPVAADEDVRHLHAALAQPLGQPRAVAVGDEARRAPRCR